MTFGTAEVHRNVLRDGEICKNKCSKNSTLLWGVNESLPDLPLLSYLAEVCVTDMHVMPLSICEFLVDFFIHGDE